jgi:hypothetical protein
MVMMSDSSTTPKAPIPFQKPSNLQGFSKSITENQKRQLDHLVYLHRKAIIEALKTQEKRISPKNRNWIRKIKRLFS